MLATLTSAAFSPFVDRAVQVSDQSGATAELVVKGVRDCPHHRPAWSDPGTRVPFSVVLRGPLHPELGHGLHAVWSDGEKIVDGVAVQRIMPLDGRADQAWYQMVFN